MEEDSLNDSLPELRELENKVGRKTPESLLVWIRDAADCEDGWRSDVVYGGDCSSAPNDGFSDKISSLKQEMRRLRSADVRILRQLVAVHEGIEAMRWLMEERDALISRGSSLTGSLSSLATVEEHGLSMSPCRESPTESTGEGSEDPLSLTDTCESNHCDTLSPESARPPSPSTSDFEATCSTHGGSGEASSSPPNGLASASSPKSQRWDPNEAPLRGIKSGCNTIRRALLRSTSRREIKGENSCFNLAKKPEIAGKNSPSVVEEKEEKAPDEKADLLGYDAQWCWVESQDDVTFL